jgi:hypothetical protein
LLKNFCLSATCGADSNLPTAATLPTGTKRSKSTVLTVEDEAIVVAFRRHPLLSLDDCLCALPPTLHRCLKRQGTFFNGSSQP